MSRGGRKCIRAAIDAFETVPAKDLADQSSQDLHIYRCDRNGM